MQKETKKERKTPAITMRQRKKERQKETTIK